MAWNLQVPDAEYYTLSDPALDGIVREVYDQKRVAIDTETDGLDLIRCKPFYWSLSWTSQGGRDRRLTMPAETMQAFKRSFDDLDKNWIFANAKFDVHMCANKGIDIKGRLLDVSVMHALLYDEDPHGLKEMALSLLGWKWTDFSDTFGKVRKGMCRCGATQPAHEDKKGYCAKTGCGMFRQISPLDVLRKAEQENMGKLIDYAANDAYGTLKLADLLTKEMEETPILGHYDDEWPYIRTMKDYYVQTEIPFTRVLYTCERNGLKVDRKYLEGITPGILKDLEALKFEINRITGRVMKTSGPGLAKYFVEENGIRPFKMTKGGKSGIKKASVDSKLLQWIADDRAGTDVGNVARLLLEHEAIAKQYSTYIQKMPARLDTNDRVHMRLNQDIARCMPAGELVLTNRGYIPVETVCAGDLVLAHTGKAREVLEVSKHPPQPIYKVTLRNGLVLRTNGSHPYLCGKVWVRADRLRDGKIPHKVTVHSGPEEWRPVPGWPDYVVSSWGRVQNVQTGRILALQKKNKWGHLKITLSRNGAQKRGRDRKDFAVHQLVAMCFRGYLTTGAEVRHLDGIAWNNTSDNLSYGTSKENTEDARRHGTLNGAPILTAMQVQDIRKATRLGQPASSTSKLSYAIAVEIRLRSASGEKKTKLAHDFKVTYKSVADIVAGRTWATPKCGVSAKELGDKYGVSEACIRDIWAGRRWQRATAPANPTQFTTSDVLRVEVEAAKPTYGLTVAEDHSHVTGGIVTHNTGRLSSSDPNMQNVTTGEKDRFHLRNAFIAELGYSIVVADYSQLEMRILAAASQEPAMMGIFHNNWDIHMGNASLVFDLPYDDIVLAKKVDKQVKEGKLPPTAMTKYVLQCLKARGDAKTIGFGLNYGMKEKAMAARMGCSVEEAINKIEQYMAKYPAVQQFFNEAVESAREYGAAYTLLGRRRRLPNITASKDFIRFRAERQASNMPIQGTAAEACKLAMIHIYEDVELREKYGYRMCLQVHDEIVGECPTECVPEVKARIREWMEHPFPTDIGVPLIADIGSGPSWGSAK